MALSKTQGWELRLSASLAERRARPFAWGENDCALWPADACLAMTGTDPAATLRGAYASEEQADSIIVGYGSVEAMFSALIGRAPHEEWRRAQRGDIVLLTVAGMLTGGVVDDTGIKIAVVGPDGLVRVPLRLAEKVWPI